MEAYSNVLLDLRRDEGVAVLSLDRPDRLNALNVTIREEIARAAKMVAEDDSFGALVITGNGGRAFSVGADLKESGSSHRTVDLDSFVKGAKIKNEWLGVLTNYPKAIISAVNGYAIGSGVTLAVMADILIGTPNAEFRLPHIKLGIAPGTITLLKLARSIGQQRTMEMVLTGRTLSAEEALRCGLLSRIVPPEELLSTAIEIGAQIAAAPRLSVAMTKEGYARGLDISWGDAVAMDQLQVFAMLHAPEKDARHSEMIDRLKRGEATTAQQSLGTGKSLT